MHCPGTNCSKRNTCANHFASGQVIDWSQYGWASCGCDKEGNYKRESETYCGDNGTYGYQKYKNSDGTVCAEECLHCPHVNLCFQILEYAGMVCRPGYPVRPDCEEIKADPEGKQKWLEEKLAERRRQIELNKGDKL